ncbi:hypothetical protein [Vibrio lentus]|uniref:hypothetical protein n=1 Tax=Vibrio lentus TaxID=136468 RepID=UPI000C858139|nr:hypothetical protein [Vibrio lentus]PML06371.1 hypothetical protein BCT85_06215 [Vibrio lentus]
MTYFTLDLNAFNTITELRKYAAECNYTAYGMWQYSKKSLKSIYGLESYEVPSNLYAPSVVQKMYTGEVYVIDNEDCIVSDVPIGEFVNEYDITKKAYKD